LVKVAVYTIALNEAAHVERWAASATDADYRVVVDTGSTDGTVERLIRAGVTVHRIAMRPWRFDDARNAAMALLPADADVCLSMDMDEFLEPGWRPKLEAAWTPGTTALYCQLALRWGLDDPAPKAWPAKKFHARWGYRFHRAVHEELISTTGEEVAPGNNDILIHHVQDRSKGTRAQYLPLLEVAHKEDPTDSQICFWLGRDLMWTGQHSRAVEVLEHYLALPSTTWHEERAEAMRCLARMQPERKMQWLDQARAEAPHRRETWLDIAEEYYAQGDWLNLFWACANGIEKTHRTGSYLDDPQCWGAGLYDLGAVACWQLDMGERATNWGRQATTLNPDDKRLHANSDAYGAGKAAALASAPGTRMFTSWGTAVHVDVDNGEIGHGALDSNAGSAVFLGDPVSGSPGRHGWLAHQKRDSRDPGVCGTDHAWVRSRAGGNNGSTTPTAFQIVPLERGLVGLRSSGRYLCAEPDGRLTLSKQRCSTWECFLPAEEWVSAAGVRPAETDPTIDWPRLRAATIPAGLREH
jgi:tetratricopeptide (TPR) repeat protein